jgi:diguanylate cyclase (GGDEF)-like protein
MERASLVVHSSIVCGVRFRIPVHVDKSSMRSLKKLPVLVLVLTLVVIGAVTLLEDHTDSSRRAQLRVASLTLALTDLQAAPFNADPHAGGSPSGVRAEIAADERTLSTGVADTSAVDASQSSLAAAHKNLTTIRSLVGAIYGIAVSRAGLNSNREIPRLQQQLTSSSQRLFLVLRRISQADADHAAQTRLAAILGTAGAMLALMGVFLVFYFRSLRARTAAERLARENEELLGLSQREATTDALTGIGNRRALTDDLHRAILSAAQEPELLLAMFDLNGFKHYNDTFGHGAGDALLARLGERLSTALTDRGTAYRMGGDEFCVLARSTVHDAEGLLADAAVALSESGDGWEIDSSSGAVWIPSEANSAPDALRIADQRMYANKASRSSASRQLTDVLLQVLSEQQKDQDQHVNRVSELATRVARALGRPSHEVQRICLAAKLHDIGKTAIPSRVLHKPGPLDEHEWAFVRQHTIVGERIVLAAPALAHTAALIRSSHERPDGTGYPDGLTDRDIPLGSKIITVCDAFDAMTSRRPYRQTISTRAALSELTRCAGTQFDPQVVDTFCDIINADPDVRGRGQGLMQPTAI